MILQGGETLTQETGTTEKVLWTCEALDLLAEHTDEGTGREILTGCACHYPLEDLADGSVFITSNGKRYKKIEKIRKRYKCLRLDDKRLYLFSPVALVTPEKGPVL